MEVGKGDGKGPPPLFSKKAPSLSFGQYMASKIRKLRGQNDGISSVDRLFAGIVVFVNGHTEPPKEELRRLVLLHGGQYEAYQTSRVTHMIATHLAESKLKELLRARKPLPVLHPKWIVDSIANGRLCRTQPYLYSGYRDAGQTTLQLTGAANIPLNTPPHIPRPHQHDSSPHAQPSTTPPLHRVTRKSPSQCSPAETPPRPVPPRMSLSPSKPPISPSQPDVTASQPDLSPAPLSPAPPQQLPPRSPLHRPPPARVDASGAPTVGGSRALSTRDGAAAFVRNFFAKSRLHHIGSWKSFFQAHAPELMAGAAVYDPSAYGRCESATRVILHVDMDCFFVSVALRHLPPVYRGLPVAVAHSGYSSHTDASTSEISSCNYVARSKGLRAGMFMERAKGLCPDLVVLPYDFEAIESVSCTVYRIFFRFTPAVQAVSCDEAFLEFPLGTDGAAIAAQLRDAIASETKCTASVGVSSNILLARLATKRAKPDGVCTIDATDAAVHIDALPVAELPGVGHVTRTKLAELNISTCAELQAWTVAALTPHVGPKTAQTLHGFARGLDCRPLERFQVAKSLSAEISYGVRLDSDAAAVEFVAELAKEVAARLAKGGFRAETLTIKAKIRQASAPLEPGKFLGCGAVDATSKSMRLPTPMDGTDDIVRAAIALWQQFHVIASDIRGIGIQAAKLSRRVGPSCAPSRLEQWVTREPDIASEPPAVTIVTPAATRQTSAATNRPPANSPGSLTLSQIDPSVLEALPAELQREVLGAVRPRVDQQWPASYSLIDTSVLEALPADLQREVRRTFHKPAQFQPLAAKRKAARPAMPPRPPKRTTPSPPRFSQIDASVWHELPASIQNEFGFPEPPAPPPTPTPPADGSLDACEAKVLRTIDNRRLDVAAVALRRLKRRCFERPADFNAVLHRCNDRVRELFGYALAPACVRPFPLEHNDANEASPG
ncbi:DNA repair protein REV1 [Achlya hypogyna]|uniref:DNA repair protein REV1 n=1 Tax=Achlya hypogyna TaxID=1202772 RepID=A0A1V9Z9L1_ACHHY|nr:DNA repair protein REV1 [Achlya hypogyna]